MSGLKSKKLGVVGTLSKSKKRMKTLYLSIVALFLNGEDLRETSKTLVPYHIPNNLKLKMTMRGEKPF